MLTDDEARTLMHRAADTIEVGPSEALPNEQPTRRWPIVLAAAGNRGRGGRRLLPSALTGTRTRARNAYRSRRPPIPVETPPALADDQVPSCSHTALAEAMELLEGKGLHRAPAPRADLAASLRTSSPATLPSTGEKLRPGDVVKVVRDGTEGR